ncbi:tripartite motif containing 35 [Phyllostomus discolor]|uniref:E3 ubiquitin-protein ligase TRIM35 n=2 Tax=Phyllostomus discolor TaxID=89673 RepID=A0A6J2MC06_9CHIR|nr:tripartite motif-containing protein 35 [Phyllostomus discolor]XP_036994989.1 E3 ubiquitin-protein ligase TRIM35 [Artibeus jamaicensis]KAF6097887.1 tripartite motif containing 35 [Phyllostomus discolor]
MEPGPAVSPGPFRSFKEELLCAVCYDPFRDAVTLRCGHNFCRECVTSCWEAQVSPSCPVCKDRAASADLRTNHTLNNLVEKLLREEAEGPRWKGHRFPRLCRLHRGQFNLFCIDDKELLCCSCQADPRHQGHRVQTVKDTAQDFRAKCRNMEHSLREKAKASLVIQHSYQAIAKHNQEKSAWLEKRIRQEFDKLREFLRVEEQAILDAVAEETRQKQLLAEEKMKQLRENTKTLMHETERLQMEMKEDDVSFLMKHKSRKRRLFCTMEPEPIQPGMLIDICKYLDSLQYRVWRKMVMSVESVPFSFDPNTAAGWLSVSDDLTSVTNHGYRVQVENPERFSSAPCLLGSRTFSQGSHAWEVDLGTLPSWRVGVARMRQDTGTGGHSHSCYQDTRSGFWYLCRTQGVEGDHCVTSDPTTSPLVPSIPRRLRVELECEEGELSFYDAERHNHLYTFHARFGEVRPYFYLGGTRGDGPPKPMRICPLRITIKEELDG